MTIKCTNAHLHFLENDALGVRGTSEGVGSVLGAQVSLVVLLVSPALGAAAGVELTSSPDSTRLAHLDAISTSEEQHLHPHAILPWIVKSD